MMNFWPRLFTCSCLLLSPFTHAGVVVTQNLAPGATSWPGAPILSTRANPSTANVSESFTGGGGNTNLSQTFTVTGTNYTLERINIYAGIGTGTGPGTNLVLRLYDLGNQTAPNPDAYSAGADLIGGGSGLAIIYTSQAAGILQLDFTGEDQVLLRAGRLYAFEVTGNVNTTPLLWYRGTSDSYAGGAAYRNRSWINGNSARDFTMAVYGSVYTNEPPPPPPVLCTVNWTDVRQVIDGFGASSAWRGSWSTALANMLFSTNNGNSVGRNGSPYSYTGIGLSLLRTRIAPGATTVEQSIMQMAQARGARVWSAPWSPAAQFKDNNQANGGSFVGNTTNYAAYASQLARYVVNMKNQYGINLYALSVQNEPDANVTTYESCRWTAQQIHDFIPYLHGALVASNVASTKIMLPESQNWTDPQGLRLTTMNNPATAALVGIIANHNYVPNNAIGDQNPPAAINNYGKALWQTEVSKLSGDDSSIEDGLYWAGRVHQFLTVAQANAWHYWWLCAFGTSNEGLCDTNDVPAKRMYTLGNFSRFVRPGFHRIGVANNTGALQISAYKNMTNGHFAIVAINPTGSDITQIFNLDGFTVGSSVVTWLTSASASLAPQAAIVVNGAAFTNLVPARSVITFTGQASPPNSPPSLVAISDLLTNVGQLVTVTNVAEDPDLPEQTLVFDLLTGPTNATLDASSGVLTWRPLVSQGDTTNLIQVTVADDGLPSLSATNSYTITVNPLVPATFGPIEVTDGQVSLVVTGVLGPDYTLWDSTNLVDWRTLFTTNPSTMPLHITVPLTDDPQRFFHFEPGP